VVHAGVKKNALGGRGLAGVNVRRDTNIAVALDGGLRAMMSLISLKQEIGPAILAVAAQSIFDCLNQSQGCRRNAGSLGFRIQDKCQQTCF
jgi:hypothetical protein